MRSILIAAAIAACLPAAPALAQFADNSIQIELRRGDITTTGLISRGQVNQLMGGSSGVLRAQRRAPRAAAVPAHAQPLRIAVVDGDNDGVFSRAEQIAARDKAPAEIRQAFDLTVADLDANKDGVLTRAEYDAGRGRAG